MIKMKWNSMKLCILKVSHNLMRKFSFPTFAYGVTDKSADFCGVVTMLLQKLDIQFDLSNELLATMFRQLVSVFHRCKQLMSQ